MVPSSRRNRIGRQLSPPVIHQKIIWMLSNFHKNLMNAGREHQEPRRAAHSLWKEIGQNIKDKKRDKRVRDETHPGEGVVKEEKFPNSRKPFHWWVCGEFWNLRGKHNQEGKKKQTTQNRCLTTTPSGEVTQTLMSAAGQRGSGCMLRVRTGPECPENNMRELTWDRNPNWGIAREREKKKRIFPWKALTWCGARPTHRTKDWANTKGELAGCRPAPPHVRGREASVQTARARRQGAISAQRRHPPPTYEQAPSC